MKVMSWFSYIKIAPIPLLLTFVSVVKGSPNLGSYKTRLEVMAAFNDWKVLFASAFHSKALFKKKMSELLGYESVIICHSILLSPENL